MVSPSSTEPDYENCILVLFVYFNVFDVDGPLTHITVCIGISYRWEELSTLRVMLYRHSAELFYIGLIMFSVYIPRTRGCYMDCITCNSTIQRSRLSEVKPHILRARQMSYEGHARTLMPLLKLINSNRDSQWDRLQRLRLDSSVLCYTSRNIVMAMCDP